MIDFTVFDRARRGEHAALRTLYIEIGRLEGEAAVQYHRGWQDCLDALGAPNPDAAPMERAANLLRQINRPGVPV